MYSTVCSMVMVQMNTSPSTRTGTENMPKLLDEIYRLQNEIKDLDDGEQRLLKMCANLLESHYDVKDPRNRLTVEEYMKVPGRWELVDGMLSDY